VTQIEDLISELSAFAEKAEETLNAIDEKKEENTHLFGVFSEKMLAIRGAAEQLELKGVTHIARLGEEIAIRAQEDASRAQVRKCVGSLWDTLTTTQFILKSLAKGEVKTSEEQDILLHRLEKTLESLGGPRESMDQSEIEALLSKQSK